MIKLSDWLIFFLFWAIALLAIVYGLNKIIHRQESFIQNAESKPSWALHETLVARIVALEEVLIMNSEDRNQWIITDLNNKLVNCEQRAYIK